MSLQYYPLTRILPNQYTRGGEYLLPDGKLYTGRYYITYTGEAFTGVNPVLGTNIPLIPAVITSKSKSINGRVAAASLQANIQDINEYDIATQQTNRSDKLTELTPYYPIPIESDYQRGYFTRYFAKTVSGPGYVFEISREDFANIEDGNFEDNVLGYESIDMLWQLTGPRNDTRVSQYQIKGGVFDTNKRVTESKNKVFRGLVEFIGGDYTKFARITP